MSKLNGKTIGVDNGYGFTKTSKGICFASTVKNDTDVYNDDVIQTQCDNENFIVGEPRGSRIKDADKLISEENREILRMCTLTSIGLSYPTETFIDANVVVGVPVAYYKAQKDAFREMILGLSDKITINKLGFEQNILIKDALVYPQSAGLIFDKALKNSRIKTETSLVIDIGEVTWDVSLFHGLKFMDGKTYKKGMSVLYGEITSYLTQEYFTSFEDYEMYDLLKRGYFTCSKGRVSTDILKNLISNFIRDVADKIKNQFSPDTIDNIFLIGGGAKDICPYLDKYIDRIEPQEDSQFVNAKCYELMGKMKWSR